jgi:NTP pyrophosphatase (non-canonical NTP hydrolase)
MEIEMDEIIELIRSFNKERDWDQYHTPKNLAMALVVEAGELVEHFQWLTPEQSQNLNGKTLRRVRQEIADVLLYLLNLADKLDLDPIAAARDKLAQNAEKYPVHKVKGKATKYTDL